MAGGHGLIQISPVTTFEGHGREISVGIPPPKTVLHYLKWKDVWFLLYPTPTWEFDY